MKKLLIATLSCVTLFVSPWNSVDPINLPKMFLLGICGLTICGLFFSEGFKRLRKLNYILLFSILVFVLQSTLTFVLTKADWAFKLYGTPGRNTGFFTYLLFVMILVCTSYLAGKNFGKNYLKALLITSLILGVYGFAQFQGHEIFKYVSYYSNNVFGTFGNSNFHSAFMGISSAAILVLAVYGKLPAWHRVILLMVFIILLWNIFLSSSQGFLCVVGGFLSASIYSLFKRKKIAFGILTSAISFLGLILFVLSIFNSGPFARFIYETSVQVRGFYWEAATRIIRQHPLLGVGFDGYGDWFNRTRSLEAFNYNSGVVSDSAHNIPLDIGTSGGILLFGTYVFIQFLVLKSAWSKFKSDEIFDEIYVALLAAWVAYTVQSLLSINQIALGVWGWSLTGLLIGYGQPSKSIQVKKNGKKTLIKNIQKQSNSSTSTAAIAFCMILGLAISFPPYLASTKFYAALQSGNFKVLTSSAYLKPYDRSRFFNVALILKENKRYQEALEVLIDATRKYPDYYSAWLEIRKNPSASKEQIATAEKEIERLEPRSGLMNGGI